MPGDGMAQAYNHMILPLAIARESARRSRPPSPRNPDRRTGIAREEIERLLAEGEAAH